MIEESRIAVLLLRAKEAEEMAAKTNNPDARERWIKIAALYRELAKGRET